jgi:hypothetical protein
VPWRLNVRAGPKVDKDRFDGLAPALDELERRGRELVKTAPRGEIDVMTRQFEPVQQVAARLEVSGPQALLPKTHAGVDVRGDGSVEAYVGRVRRVVVDQRNGEDAFAALRRVLWAQSGESAPAKPS